MPSTLWVVRVPLLNPSHFPIRTFLWYSAVLRLRPISCPQSTSIKHPASWVSARIFIGRQRGNRSDHYIYLFLFSYLFKFQAAREQIEENAVQQLTQARPNRPINLRCAWLKYGPLSVRRAWLPTVYQSCPNPNPMWDWLWDPGFEYPERHLWFVLCMYIAYNRVFTAW